MGCYVNPTDIPKEQWLSNYEAFRDRTWSLVPSGYLPVCMIDNGVFTAAGVAYGARCDAANAASDSMRRAAIVM